ncbi:MAG: sugar phosphate isomerase/epimerase, partial [Oscillospiraceae bacterium]|nr:sugar phosphate isomerase/epimerase [Oscillospiraceae bacterium]
LRLREAVGDIIGANFDPSHLIWQGMDPVAALQELKGAVYHFHAKDTRMDVYNTATNGVLDTRSFTNMRDRSWVFRTIGYGSDEKLWKDIISTLSMIGYDGAVSIEHEDGLMSPREGLEKAIEFLKGIIIREKPDSMWWS